MYAVIDIEQADSRHKGSICSIGIAFVENNSIIDTFYSLVRPLVPFNPVCVSIHHITEDDVVDAPTFRELWPDLYQRIANIPLVAYRAETDIYAIEKAIHDAHLEAPQLQYADAYRIAKKLLDLPSYKLSFVAESLGISLTNAHNALADAEATASVLIKLQRLFNANDLDDLLESSCEFYSYSLDNYYVPDRDIKKPVRTRHIETAVPIELHHGTCDHFNGKYVLFTGDLKCTTRAMAQKAVTEMGGICKDSPSKKINICITGIYDKSTLCEGACIGKKLQKVNDLIEQGYCIEILSEQEFLDILSR